MFTRPQRRTARRGALVVAALAMVLGVATACAPTDGAGPGASPPAGASQSPTAAPSLDETAPSPTAPASESTSAPTDEPSEEPTDEPTVRPDDRFCMAGRDLSPDLDDDGGSGGVEWRLDLDERFDTLDRGVWNVRDQSRLDHESSYLLARNVTTRKGKLAIRAVKESVGGRDYTSGFIDTNGRYALPDTFRVEVRAKVAMERGMWSAPLWLRPADRSGGEIDLVETTHQRGTRPRLHQTIHTDYGAQHRKAARRLNFAKLGDRRGTRWHTYTLRKTPGLVAMWVDGELTAAFCTGSPDWYDDFYEAGKQWNLRVNLHVGGWAGEPDETTDWSGSKTTMLVDHIRTWVPRDHDG